jgi:hypothetical protein
MEELRKVDVAYTCGRWGVHPFVVSLGAAPGSIGSFSSEASIIILKSKLREVHVGKIISQAATLVLCSSLFAGAAFGQAAVLSSNAREDADADSKAAMSDTVNDPRIVQSQAGEKGIWKWVVPPRKMNGACENHDPIGVAIGKLIPADCEINWTDPDSHRLFCFTSATSMVYFLNAPKWNTARADKVWRAIKGTS